MGDKHSNLDSAVVLAYLHSTRESEQESNVWRYAVIHSTNLLVTAFQAQYQINKNSLFRDLAPAIGRYPEDIYDGDQFSGGNPWFITTNAVAEFACRLGQKEIGRSFLNRVLYHSDKTGNLQEQFSNRDGFVRGAQDLSWSHASYLTAWQSCQ